MCACEPGFVCSRCAGTPQDWRYFEESDDARWGAGASGHSRSSTDEVGRSVREPRPFTSHRVRDTDGINRSEAVRDEHNPPPWEIA